MSDFNGFNNQTPPNNGNNYSYNWNGSSNGGGNKGSKTLAMIAIIAALVSVVIFGVIMMNNGAGNPPSDTSKGNSDTVSDVSDVSGTTSDETSVPDNTDTDFSGPAISDDATADLSTTLTQIYETCSPSCCTVRVSVRGQLYSIGSGFVYDAEGGYIATNHHVIESGDEIEVVFYNGDSYKATLVGSDSITDLAILHVDAKDLPQASIGDSNSKKVGENVIAIGTPYAETLAGTMTCGIISGIARDIEITNDSGKVIKTMTLIQTDCSINPGNSGGPLIDMSGNVIGITSLKLVDEQFEGIGFAIPITEASQILNKLIRGESIDDGGFASASPKIGITVMNLEEGMAEIGMDPRCEYPEGIIVIDIEYASAAYRAGLSRYDIITEFDGQAVTNMDDLTSTLSKKKAGDMVEIKVFRFNRMLTEGSEYTIKFKLDAAS